jgi:hypothetical protein
MIHFCAGQTLGQDFALNERAAAGRAPVGLCLLSEHRVTLAANPFHIC